MSNDYETEMRKMTQAFLAVGAFGMVAMISAYAVVGFLF